MSIENEFPTVEAMEQVVITAMGVREGLTQAVGQIDAILAGPHGPRRRRLGPRVPRRDRRRRRRVTPACSSRRSSSGRNSSAIDGVHWNLDLVDERRFGNGVVLLRFRAET
jgi:hypothetical protein